MPCPSPPCWRWRWLFRHRLSPPGHPPAPRSPFPRRRRRNRPPRKRFRHRYEALRKTSLRTSPGKGTIVAAVARGKELTSTGRTSGKYVQLSRAGKTGWAASADIRRAIMAKYQTSSATPLYASAGSTRQLAKIPADYTLGTRTNAKSNGRVKVEYAGKSGWVRSSRVAKVASGVPVGNWAGRPPRQKTLPSGARECRCRWGEQAQHGRGQRLGRPHEWKRSPWTPPVSAARRLDPNHPMALAVQYHECAHILQYRAYKYDFAKLDRRMNAVYGKPRVAAGTEHMADCMAVAMGAKLTGSEYDRGSGYTITWFAGYGGKCTSQHLAAARKVIAGQQV